LFYTPENFINVFRNQPKFRALSIPGPTDCPKQEKFISVVTTCMNRLSDLKNTLPRNIEDNKEYDNAEFIVLDYNSTENVEGWIKRKMMHHIKSGKLKFYRTECSRYFQPNHSRNLSFRLATGELVANVDTDNIIHKGFLIRLNECAAVADEKILICAEDALAYGSDRFKLRGRFCLYKKDIEFLRGFDEDLDNGFSHDDVNFFFRAMMSRFKMVRYEKSFNWGRKTTPDPDKVQYVRNPDMDKMKIVNAELTLHKLMRGIVSVNHGREWGAADVTSIKAD
jgi:glycosyltransferase involved in cell wall biosynthesis